MTISLKDVNETLLPRRYQEEIFSRAQQSNVIAALDTGSGKTYISTLLIKWMATRNTGAGKIIVFLVPKVALVEQQGQFIANQTPLRVSKCYGATAIDLSDREAWKAEIEGHDVLVMTAQIFLNIITHSHWSLDRVSLMVFDECHHTRKNHAYNGIMREYFQFPPNLRPKIFGMTASPIWNPRDATDSLHTLERNLDATVIAVREHVDELLEYSPKPREIIHEYAPSPVVYPFYPTPSLWERLKLFELPPEIDIPVDKIRTRYDVTLSSLGPYGADLFLYADLKQRITQISAQASGVELEYLNINFFGQDDEDVRVDAASTETPPEIQEIEKVLAECAPYFDDNPESGEPLRHISLKWCSPKVVRLVEILFTYYTPTFQSIVFVEQRHVAASLAKILPRVAQLNHLVKSAQLIGHGATSLARSNVKGMALKTQQDIVKQFREGEVNTLIATSVAEEGLDFPACDLVIRFDPLQHMVGYVQSRGRARHRTSTFVVMVQQGQTNHLARYTAFVDAEPLLKEVYQSRELNSSDLAEEEERDDPADLAERERYVVPSTGAILTYNTAIGALNHLCTLIPRDRFTPVHLPQYSGDFQSTLRLPSNLPLPLEHLIYVGPSKRTKKEAKRAVAFIAVKQLHTLNVFDDYLLPVKSAKAGRNEDADGRHIPNVSNVPDTMDVIVRDPWVRGKKQYLHVIYVDGRPTAGLVTGSMLPLTDLVCNGVFVSTGEAKLVEFDEEIEWYQRRAMEDYMRMGLWWCITGRGITLPLTCYLVPITHDLKVDFDVIDLAAAQPQGFYDWSAIGEEHYNHILVMCNKEHGRPLLLRQIRTDLSPMSVPPEGTRESGFPTYRDFWLQKFTRKNVVPEVPVDGPLVEARLFARHTSSIYSLDGSYDDTAINPPIMLYPLGMCRWAPMSEDIYNTFRILPELCHRVTDIYRARCARIELSLPPIVDDLMVQALTLPTANAGFNNQRLETLGDSVLKLSTVVYLFNRFPHRHEGQLDVLRRNCVSNRTLLARAKENGLEQFLTSEMQSMRIWRYTLPPEFDPIDEPRRCVPRRFPRRSLQDCMEALLGAAFATGGITMALRAGTALGLSFGGPLHWTIRYGGTLPVAPAAALFLHLQETLGYEFRHGHLLLEAVTHPSFHSSDSQSYQRLEFLGDALIDLVVMRYLYLKFPTATSGQLSAARSRVVCAPALASVAVKHLGLQKILLVNNAELSITIGKYVPILEGLSSEDIVNKGWKQDPPKAISDVLESVVGAVFVDTWYDFEKTSAIVEPILHDLLVTLSPDMPRDPVSELMVWTAQSGCRKISFRKSQSRPDLKRNDSVSVLVHDHAVVGPIIAPNLSSAKGRAAELARFVLDDSKSQYHLPRICDCKKTRKSATRTAEPIDGTEEIKALDDETEDGFATLAQLIADGAQLENIGSIEEENYGIEDMEISEDEQEEVESMMQVVHDEVEDCGPMHGIE